MKKANKAREQTDQTPYTDEIEYFNEFRLHDISYLIVIL